MLSDHFYHFGPYSSVWEIPAMSYYSYYLIGPVTWIEWPILKKDC